MITKYITHNIKEIYNAKKYIEIGDDFYNKLKDIVGIKYLEEVLGEQLILNSSWWGVQIDIDKEVHLDLVCSVVGEIEEVIGLTANMEIDSTWDSIYYRFKDELHDTKLKIKVGRPHCRFITESEEYEYYREGEIKSHNIKKRVICT